VTASTTGESTTTLPGTTTADTTGELTATASASASTASMRYFRRAWARSASRNTLAESVVFTTKVIGYLWTLSISRKYFSESMVCWQPGLGGTVTVTISARDGKISAVNVESRIRHTRLRFCFRQALMAQPVSAEAMEPLFDARVEFFVRPRRTR